MIAYEVRFDVELMSASALAQYMKHRNETVRSLAVQVDKINRGATKSRSIIGHLRSGKRRTCSPDTARAIESALNAPPGSLFVPKLSTVTRERGRAA